MHLLIPFFVFVLASVFMPRAWRAFELTIVAPFIGLALGGFVWSVAAMFSQRLVDLPTFEAFVVAGIVVMVVIFIIKGS